jgi:hypothetical protein
MDQFSQWREAIANGKPVEYTKGSPTAGYFKRRARNEDRSIRFDAVAIWQEDGEWFCQASAGYTTTKADEIEELFVNCNSHPITYELFEAIIAGAAWPEEVRASEAAKADLPPHEAAAAALAEQQRSAKEWLTTLGHKPTTQEEADKASNYADEFAKISKRSDKARVDEKEPHLVAGRTVDARWKPIIDGAEKAKVWAKSLSEEFVRTEAARRAEEARIANEKAAAEYAKAKAMADEQAKKDAALIAKGVVVPQMAPLVVELLKTVVPEAVKIGTGSRRQSLVKRDEWEIEDTKAFFIWLSEQNNIPEELLLAAEKYARRLAMDGMKIPGMKKTVVETIR